METQTRQLTFLARKPASSSKRNGNAALEIVMHNDGGQYFPFVTHVRNADDGGLMWGHYFKTEAEALEHFNGRDF